MTPITGRLQIADNALTGHSFTSVFSTTFKLIFKVLVNLTCTPCHSALQWKYLYVITNSLHLIPNNYTYKYISIHCKVLYISWPINLRSFVFLCPSIWAIQNGEDITPLPIIIGRLQILQNSRYHFEMNVLLELCCCVHIRKTLNSFMQYTISESCELVIRTQNMANLNIILCYSGSDITDDEVSWKLAKWNCITLALQRIVIGGGLIFVSKRSFHSNQL